MSSQENKENENLYKKVKRRILKPPKQTIIIDEFFSQVQDNSEKLSSDTERVYLQSLLTEIGNLNIQQVNPEELSESKDDESIKSWEEFYRDIKNQPRIDGVDQCKAEKIFSHEDHLSLLEVQKRLNNVKEKVDLDEILSIIISIGNGFFQGKFSVESFWRYFRKIKNNTPKYIHFEKLALINILISVLEEEKTDGEIVDLYFTMALKDSTTEGLNEIQLKKKDN
ncbi:hypothetical protein NGRA_0193 [Nosema granulosis]|uniref:Uncharacterized protein n=1 Tax=Nosema granulosis TaxID=83296 RepID=A0A9P6L0S7_9MICR|nr:hypothetical protein NGRA_0193 [Nosema granulosis]